MFFKRKPGNEKEIENINEGISQEPELPQEEFIRKREPESAPLFVKVEKYQNLLVSINEMRSFVSGMKQLFNVLYELETVRNESLKMMRATVQRLEKNLLVIDSELLRPKGIDMQMQHSEAETHHIENSLGELQRQLADLRRELQELK